MGQRLTAEDFNHAFRYFKTEAFRLECQPVYLVDEERETFEEFQNSAKPQPVTEYPFYAAWLDRVRDAASHGRRLTRVRVLEEPPTTYQQWEIWAAEHNIAAGETVRYIPRSQANEIGLPVDDDWWLFDDASVALMHFTAEGHPRGGEILTDPELLARHQLWKDLAVRHSTLDPRCITVQENA